MNVVKRQGRVPEIVHSTYYCVYNHNKKYMCKIYKFTGKGYTLKYNSINIVLKYKLVFYTSHITDQLSNVGCRLGHSDIVLKAWAKPSGYKIGLIW